MSLVSDLITLARYIKERSTPATQAASIRDAAICTTAAKEIKVLQIQLEAAKSVLWMAEKYAEAGGGGGPEMREFKAAQEVLES